jgi:hypothetical protein
LCETGALSACLALFDPRVFPLKISVDIWGLEIPWADLGSGLIMGVRW